MTFITVIVWTALDVYHVHVVSQVPQNLQKELEPLDPKLNLTLVEEIKGRYDLNSLPQPVVTAPPVASKSATVATASGTLTR